MFVCAMKLQTYFGGYLCDTIITELSGMRTYGSGMPLSEQADAFCRGDRDLIIEDDTIYEIDRECLGCRQERVRAGKRV
jgi:hypothetical protein